MKTQIRTLATISTIALAGFGLTACGGGEAGATSAKATPNEVMQTYVKALQDKDYEKALTFVADTEIDPTKIQNVEDTTIPEAHLAQEPELDKEQTSVQLSYTFGNDMEPEKVSFVKGEEGWKLNDSIFIHHYEDAENESSILNRLVKQDPTVIKTGAGQSLFENGQAYLVHPEMEIPVTIGLQSEYLTPIEGTGTLTNGEFDYELQDESGDVEQSKMTEFTALVKDYTKALTTGEESGVDGGYTVKGKTIDLITCEPRQSDESFNAAIGDNYVIQCEGTADYTFNKTTEGQTWRDPSNPTSTYDHTAGGTETYDVEWWFMANDAKGTMEADALSPYAAE